MNAGVLQIDSLRARLRTERIGRRIEHLASTTSTNDEAWGRIEAEYADGLVVFAEYQSAGRGRFGRTWESPRGAGLLCSVALIDQRRELSGGGLGLLTAVAACDAITACTAVVPTIGWPNDLLVSGRKLGGILIEARLRRDGVGAYVVGIGINCLQVVARGGAPARVLRGAPAAGSQWHASLGDTATSLETVSGHAVDRTALAGALLAELDRRLARLPAQSDAQLRREWLERAEPMGQRVCLKHAGKVFSGSMIDLDPAAALLVRLDDGGVRAFDAASTTIIKPEAM